MNKIFVLVPLLVLAALMPLAANAAGYLHFKPEKDARVPGNQFLAINGTSAPSNATHTGCIIKFQTNGHGYQATTPHGPKGAADYTNWSATTSEMIKLGPNSLEAQIACFPASGNATSAPNYIHHLVHNITGV